MSFAVGFQSVWQDVRLALRTLRHNLAFSSIAILTLALGIGANTAIFSILNAALLKSLPFRNPSELMAISETHPQAPEAGAPLLDYDDWRAQSHSFSSFGAYLVDSHYHLALTGQGEPQQLRCSVVSHDLFSVLGIAPLMGRNFVADEDEAGKGQVVILSGELWKSRFAADPGILGRSVELDGKKYMVVGILAPGAKFPQYADSLFHWET